MHMMAGPEIIKGQGLKRALMSTRRERKDSWTEEEDVPASRSDESPSGDEDCDVGDNKRKEEDASLRCRRAIQ